MNEPTRSRGGGTVREAIGRLIGGVLAFLRRRVTRDHAGPPAMAHGSDPTDEPQGRAERLAMTLRLRSLGDILRDAADGPEPIATLVTYPRETVTLAPLRSGAETLARIAIRENERHSFWQQTSYLSLPTSAFVLTNALVHGSAGLIGIGDQLVTETTWHTDPGRHRYHVEGDVLRIEADRVPFLAGTHLSLLTPGGNNYWHALIDGVAKLSVVPEGRLDAIETILFSSDAIGQAAFLGLVGLPHSVALRPVQPGETFRVEKLVLPWDLHGVFDYHPVLNRFFDAVLTHHTVDGDDRIERLYVDRRGSSQRRLLNEDNVVIALEAMGFVPVRLEELSIERQVALFRQAAIIVSPHGAGLTNIGFAATGCIVVELMMDAYLNWCFRRIAALRGLDYDCAIGTAHRPWADLNPGFHAQVWEISVADVVRTVDRALSEHAPKIA